MATQNEPKTSDKQYKLVCQLHQGGHFYVKHHGYPVKPVGDEGAGVGLFG
ncbi:MAG TPA: hypothetical protein G4O12_07170 [Dehalococcoidia bacterium]|nr:hypothetical protein [Dehalococcoidia bacterium]